MKLKSPLIIASFLLTVSSLFAQTMPKNELVFLTSDWFGAGYIRPADECYGINSCILLAPEAPC